MRLSQYLTEYDEDLSGDSQIDPLGVLTIWSAFGQEIFRNRTYPPDRWGRDQPILVRAPPQAPASLAMLPRR